jgi:membrane protease YdiL (CAAX protease family)
MMGLGVYVVTAFGLAWLCWVPLILTPHLGIPLPFPPSVLAVAGSYAPVVGAVAAARRFPSEPVRAGPLRGLLYWRVRPWWYAAVLLGPALPALAALELHVVLGGPAPGWSAPDLWLLLPGFVLAALVPGPIGEEPGWRGYALPLLQKPLGAVLASLIVGVIWAAWHLPLFLIPGTLQHSTPILSFLAWVVALSVIFAWLFNRTGSLLMVVLLHASVNVWWWILPVLPAAVVTARPWLLSVAFTWCIAVICAIRLPIDQVGRTDGDASGRLSVWIREIVRAQTLRSGRPGTRHSSTGR